MKKLRLAFVAKSLNHVKQNLSSPLSDNIETWRTELQHDSDREFLLPGVADGFHVTDENSHFCPAQAPNNKSALKYKAEVEKQIISEIDSGAYVCVSDKPTIISPLGADDRKKKIRVLHDGSQPSGGNLNSYATKNSFKYVTLDEATKLIPKNGYIAKVDIRHAYRSVGIHRNSIDAAGLQWTFEGDVEPTTFVDTRLMFGARKAPEIFQRISNSVVRMMKRRGYIVISYLDDFLIIADNYLECLSGYHVLINLLESLGFTVSLDKCVSACQKLTYLGVEISTVNRTLSLDNEKLETLHADLAKWDGKKSATKRELQQIIGRLSWAARVIRGGRTFLRRLIDLMASVKRKSHHTRINSSARADFLWWKNCVESFNGSVYFLDENPLDPADYSTDACNVGGAGYFQNDWFYVNWAVDYPDIAQKPIWMKELFTVLVSARRWAPFWKAKHVHVHCDNSPSVFMINKGTTKDALAMSWLRELFWLSVKYEFYVTAKFISGKDNFLSDMISRMHDVDFMFKACLVLNMQPIVYNNGDFVFNVYNNMSYNSYTFLQSVFRSGSGTNFSKNCFAIKEKLIQKIQRKLTVQCV